MTRNRMGLVPFALLIAGANSEFTKTLDDLTLLGSSKGSKCEPGHNILKEECIEAASLLGGVLRNDYFQVGSWPDTPPGCFIQHSDKAIHYGENPDSINDGLYQPVCVTPAEDSTLLQAGKGMKCKAGKDFSKDECIAAATSIGGTLLNGEFKVGAWSHTPYGCFVEGEDKVIHFGTNIAGVNIGYSQPVCKTALDEARLLPSPWDGAKCKPGHNFPKDDCAAAALSVGGKLRNGEFIIGDFPDSPPGCFLEPSDKAVHYNTNGDAANNGQFQPVCMVGKLKIRAVPAALGTRCKPELEIPKEDCVAAAQTVGGQLRGGNFLVGDWSRTPSGCFMQKSDKSIHFSTNLNGVNNGQFQPICIKEDVEPAYLTPHLYKGTKCIPGHDFSVDDCIVAGTSVGGRLRKRKYLVGAWDNTPYGCFLEAKDKAIHFGTNTNAVNNGYFKPICKPGEIEATKLDASYGVKCADEHDFSKEECVDAGTVVGGILRDDTFLIGDWSNSPPGCFIDPSDNAIHYGTDDNGVNIGVFEPVCKTVAHEAALLPAKYADKCAEGTDFLKEDCIVAAMSVGGRLRGGSYLIGSWPMAPPGCFIESKDNAIHFNMIDGINIGAYQSVCIYA